MSATADAVDETPRRLGAWLTTAAAAVAVVAVGVGVEPAVVAVVGLAASPIGASRGSRRLHTIGATCLFGGVIVAGVVGAPTGRLLLGTVAAVVAWDAGDHAIGLGSQLGGAATRGVHLVHVGATVAVAVVAAAVAYAVSRAASAGQPTTAVALLLVAGLLFAWVLDR